MLLIFCVFCVGVALYRGTPRDTEDKDCTHIAFANLDGTGPFQAFADAKMGEYEADDGD